MNRSEKYFKTLRGLLLLAVAALVAGCGNGGKSTGAGTGNQAAAACNCVPLGAAGNYAILARLGISTPLLTETITPTVVTGNVGLSPNPASSITGFSLSAATTYSTSSQVIGQVFASNYEPPTPFNLNTAVLHMQAAYNDAAGRAPTSEATRNLNGGTLTNLTLTTGVYQWDANVAIPTDLSFSGTATDIFILKVAGNLNMAADRNIVLLGEAQAKNIYWQVAGAVTVGARTNFKGIILGKTSITFENLATIDGRLLAQSTVALDANRIAPTQ